MAHQDNYGDPVYFSYFKRTLMKTSRWTWRNSKVSSEDLVIRCPLGRFDYLSKVCGIYRCAKYTADKA